jgi:ABC-2 type transport system permease protein
MRAADKYGRAFALGFQTALEYRANFALSLLSAAYPVVIQVFMWSAIYAGSGEAELYGYTYRQMLTYTFLAGHTARIVRTGFEYEIMEDIKSGKYSTFLVQPIGYFPYRLFAYLGQKLPNLAVVLAILAVVLLGLTSFAGIAISAASLLTFLLTLALAVALNFLIFYCFSAVAFWAVEIGYLFEGIRIVTILLSGGIFPLEVFGEGFARAAHLLPFAYTISYPINVLNGRLTPAEVAQGVAAQLVWIVLCWGLARLLWRIGQRQYVAVGG